MELMVDTITSLDGYGGAEGWPGWWGLEGPEYLGWLGEDSSTERTLLMGANTYRLMHGFAESQTEGVDSLDSVQKVVFSSTLEEPLQWKNTRLVRGDAVDAVRELKETSTQPLSTLGSLSLARSLLAADLVDRFRVVIFPVITGKTGHGRVYDDYPDVVLDLIEARTFDGGTQLLEYRPRLLDAPLPPRTGQRMSTATYTWDVFCTLDGYGSYDTENGDWGGYWSKQGPEFLKRRAAQYREDQRLVLGANTFRMFQHYLGSLTRASETDDPVNTRMKFAPTTVVSSTLTAPLEWPDATLASGDAVDVVRKLKAASDVPLRSHGSLALNWSLVNAGLVDRIQVTVFPVLSGLTGAAPSFAGVADFDLELLDSRLLDGRIMELTYRPNRHG